MACRGAALLGLRTTLPYKEIRPRGHLDGTTGSVTVSQRLHPFWQNIQTLRPNMALPGPNSCSAATGEKSGKIANRMAA